MENTIKLLCTEQEAHALLESIPNEYIVNVVEHGDLPLRTINIDNSRGLFTPSFMFSLGTTVGTKVASETIMKLIKY